MIKLPTLGFRSQRQAELLEQERLSLEIAELERTPRGAEMLALSEASVVVARLPFLLRLRPEDLRPEGDTLAERLASVSTGGPACPVLDPELAAAYEAGGYYGKKAVLALTRYLQVDAQIALLALEGGEGCQAMADWLSLRDEALSWRNAASFSADPVFASGATKKADALTPDVLTRALAVQDLEMEEALPTADRQDLLEMCHKARTDALHRDLLAVARRLAETVPGFGGREDRGSKALAQLLAYETTGAGLPLRPALEDQIRRAVQEVRRLGRPLADLVDFSNLSTPPRGHASHRSDALSRALDDALLGVEMRQETGMARTGAVESMSELRRQSLGLTGSKEIEEARARALAAMKTR